MDSSFFGTSFEKKDIYDFVAHCDEVPSGYVYACKDTALCSMFRSMISDSDGTDGPGVSLTLLAIGEGPLRDFWVRAPQIAWSYGGFPREVSYVEGNKPYFLVNDPRLPGIVKQIIDEPALLTCTLRVDCPPATLEHLLREVNGQSLAVNSSVVTNPVDTGKFHTISRF